MKFLHALAIAAAAFTAAPAAFSDSTPVAAVDSCKRAKKSIKKVCESYMAHYNAAYALGVQLRNDRLTLEHVRAHIYAANGLVRSMYRNRDVSVVAKNAATLETTTAAVLKQLEPLAKEWDNYKELKKTLVSTLEGFQSETGLWMSKKSSTAVNCDKVKKSVKAVCKAYKSHSDAVNTYIVRLKVDKLTPEFGEAHIAALNSIFKSVTDGKGKSKVKGKVKKFEKTTEAVVKQIGPLAEEWDNYAEMAKNILSTKADFDKALKAWMK